MIDEDCHPPRFHPAQGFLLKRKPGEA